MTLVEEVMQMPAWNEVLGFITWSVRDVEQILELERTLELATWEKQQKEERGE